MSKKRTGFIKMHPNGILVEVEIMLTTKGYAMVRRKGHNPFVVSRNELKEKDNG